MIHPEPIPLGISDPEGRIGAVENLLDVDLIDLLSGARLRRLTAIGKPLMIDGGQLLGWQSRPAGHHLRLFRAPLPPAGTAADWSPEVALPEWVDLRSEADTDFALRFARDGDVYALFWRARRQYRGGAPPPAFLQDEYNRQVATARIDFDVGSLAVLRQRDDDGFADDAERARRGEDLARDAGGLAYRQAGQLHNAPWTTEGGPRFLRKQGPRLSIVRGDTSASPPLVDVDADEPEQLVPELSLDGQHLAVVERRADASFWAIHSSATGAPVCRLPYDEGFKSFRIFDRRLIYLQENVTSGANLMLNMTRILHSVATDSGNSLWSYELALVTRPNRMHLPP